MAALRPFTLPQGWSILAGLLLAGSILAGLLLAGSISACGEPRPPTCAELCTGLASDPDPCRSACESKDVAYADQVIEAPGSTGEGFGDASKAVNGVRGCGQECGGLDVFSLGLQEGVDNYLVIRWSGRRVLNGPGADFVVFENGFCYGDGSVRFMDLIVVYVSRDGSTWVPFPHDYIFADETSYSPDPALWQGFAGREPVLIHEEENPVDPFDSIEAGGDSFDLDALPDDGGEASAIKREGFLFLKLVSASSLINPDTGAPFPKDPISNGADIDGVYGRWLAPE